MGSVSWTEVLKYGPGWGAVVLFVLKPVLEWHWRRQDEEQDR